MAPSSSPVPAPVTLHPPLNEAVLDELPPTNSISSVTPSEPPGFESVPLPVTAPTSTSLSSLTFVNGCRTSKPCPVLETSQDFDADIIGDDLDDLLDQAGSEPDMVSEQIWPRGLIDKWNVTVCGCLNRFVCFLLQVIPTVKGPLPLPTSIASGGSMSNSFLIDPFLHSATQQYTVTLPALYHKSGSSSYFGMDTFDPLPPPLDSLDSLTITDFKSGVLLCLVMQPFTQLSQFLLKWSLFYLFIILLSNFQIMLQLHSFHRWLFDVSLIGFFSLHIVT